MVESLKVEIALDGSEEVQSQMYKIGAAGRAAFLGIAEAAGKLSIALGAIAVALGVAATKKLIEFANAAEETEKALTQLQKVSGQSFENLSALQQVFAAGGTSAKKFAKDLGTISEKIAEAGQQRQMRNAGKEWVEQANNINTVRQQVDRLDLAFSPLVTTATKVQAILESLSSLPQTDQWFRLADIIKGLRSDTERAQVGKALGLSPEEIATLRQGSEALRQQQAEAERLGLTLTTSNQRALQQMAQGWNQFTGLLSAVFEKIGALAAPAFGQLLDIARGVLQQIVTDFQNMPLEQAIANIGDRLVPAFAALGNLLSPIATAIGEAFLIALTAALTPTTSMWDAIVADFAKFGESLVTNAGILGAKIRRAMSGGGGGGGGNAPGFASGGWVGGVGTGTSDSNLAWVSRGEYITPARAVAQPGVLAFLEALRRSGGNLAHVLDGMGRFALGGMVPRSMPAFASGGLSGGNNVTIQFPGLPPVGGLRASSAVVDELRKSAALAQVRSGGRKPSRYS